MLNWLFSGQFSCFEWSHSETHLLYVAEKKRPKAKSFFEKAAKKNGGEEDEVAKVGFLTIWSLFALTTEIS